MKSNITIHMGASVFTAKVRTPQGIINYDIHKMPAKEQHKFRRELVKAYRDATHCGSNVTHEETI